MKTLLMTHRITDLETWLGFHHEREALFSHNGVTAMRTFFYPQDPHQIALLLEVEDLDAFMAWLATQEAATAKAKHGVLEPITLLEELTSLSNRTS